MELLTFVVGGGIVTAAGFAVVKAPGLWTAAAIGLTALLLVVIIWKSQLEWPSAVLSCGVVAALAVWLSRLALK